MKNCSKCGVSKILEEFAKKNGGRHSWCKQCINHNQKEKYRINPEPRRSASRESRNPAKERAAKLRAAYGITEEQYNKLLLLQDEKCATCGAKEPATNRRFLFVDHDHSCCSGRKSCGKCIRGLLCGRCNHALGILKDSPEVLRAAIAYLESPPWQLLQSSVPAA